MKHTLSSFRRGPALRVLCLLILAVMCAPVAMAAAAAPPAAPTLAAAGGFHPLLGLGIAGVAGLGLMNAAKKDGDENGGGGGQQADKVPTPEEAIKQAEDKTLPMGQRIGVMLAALRGVAPADQFAQVKAELDTTKASLATRDGELKQANARIAALEADAKENESTIATLGKENKDLKAKEQDLERRAEAKAKERMAALGFPAANLPAPDEKVAGASSYDDAMAEYSKITDPGKRAAYYESAILPLLNVRK